MKRYIFVAVAILLTLVVSACACEHEWENATCLAPQVCSLCEETQGQPLGHKWKDATCTSPKTCLSCAVTEGSVIAHEWIEADCENAQTCSACKATEGEPLGHVLGEWQEGDEDIVEGIVVATKSCEFCEKVIEENRTIDSLISDGYFLFDAEAFADRLNIALEKSCDREDEDLYTAEYDYQFTDAGMSYCVTVYNGNGKKVALIFPNGALSKVDLTYFDIDILTDGLMSSALVYRSVIMACDPQQTYGEATSIGKKLLTQCAFSEKGFGEYSENGIYYKMNHSDFGGFLLWIKIEEQET